MFNFRLSGVNRANNFVEKIMLTVDRMYRALAEKDISFEGRFIAAVKTTGIFCRPSCTARKPKPENVEFFNTTKEALQHGYRPCKICNPLEHPNETPGYIKDLIDELNLNPSLKFKDWDLRKRGVEPSTLRRWFLKNHGMTFHAYQRMYRINSAFKKIQNGEKVADAAFSSGYESISGFVDSFKSVFGKSPNKSMSEKIIDLCRIETPLGPMIACADEQGICLLEFTDRRMLESEFKDLSKRLNATIIPGDSKYFPELRQQLNEYFDQKRIEFTVPLSLQGTVFQISVWHELLRIPYGSTRSYQQQANALGNPGAVRAVANSNGMNKIAIIVPCHRVIGSDGQLTGYGGGLWRKEFLLDLEQKNSRQLKLF